MAEKLIRYFIGVILYTVVCTDLSAYMPTPADGQFENKQTGSFINFDCEDLKSQDTISKDKQNDHSGFPQHSPIEEKEEREEREDKDETDDEASDDFSENQNSISQLVSLTFDNLLTAYRKTACIPLYMLFHSWKHFLH